MLRGEFGRIGIGAPGAQVWGIFPVSVRDIFGIVHSLSHKAMSDFSNVLSKTVIERLAQVDEYEVVKEVQVRQSTVACFRLLSYYR